MTRRKLGRGLEALIGSAQTAPAGEQERRIPVHRIHTGPHQPRRRFDEAGLKQLAASIRAQGLLSPILVRPLRDGFELIAGERRLRAAKLAQHAAIPAIVRDVDDQSAAAMALIENVQREDLNVLEEAAALQRLREQFGLTQQQVAEAVGRSREAVANLLRLLNLHPDVQTLLMEGVLEMGHARALLSLPPESQPGLARDVAARQLTVRQTEALVRKQLSDGRRAPDRPRADSVENQDTRNLAQRLSETLGAKVAINHSAKGSGRLVIHYNSARELEGILGHIQ